jgi:hypothetical protein
VTKHPSLFGESQVAKKISVVNTVPDFLISTYPQDCKVKTDQIGKGMG